MGNSPGQAITIPDDEVIRDEDVQVNKPASSPSWMQRLENWWTSPQQGNPDPYTMAKVGYAPSGTESPRHAVGSTAGLATLTMAPEVAAHPLAAIGSVAGSGIGAPAGRYLGGKVGAPTIGEDIGSTLGGAAGGGLAESFMPRARSVGAPIERDATRLNVPYAGEEEPSLTDLTRSAVRNRDASWLPPRVPSANGGRTTPFSKAPAASFDLPTTVPERESIPGAGGESWSMQRKVTPQLQQAAAAGDPGAISTMRRLNPTWSPVIMPRGAGEYPETRLGGTFEERMGVTPTQAPISSPTPSFAGAKVPPPEVPQGHQNLFEIASPMKPLRQPVQQLAENRSYGPEFDAQQREEMIGRYKAVQRNPNATREDLAEAEARLNELGATR